MTGRTAGQLGRAADIAFLNELLPAFNLIGRSLPVHIEDLFPGPENLFGISVAIDAPLHEERAGLEDERHLIDGAVARGAANALVHVNAMVEIGKLREIVNPLPCDWRTGPIAGSHGFQTRGADPDLLVAVHANLRCRHACEG